MTVSELIQALIELENAGGGDCEVWLIKEPLNSKTRIRARYVELATDDDNAVYIEPVIE